MRRSSGSQAGMMLLRTPSLKLMPHTASRAWRVDGSGRELISENEWSHTAIRAWRVVGSGRELIYENEWRHTASRAWRVDGSGRESRGN